MSRVWDQGAMRSVLAVIGDPVWHSLSPVIHNAALRTVGRRTQYLAHRVLADDLAVAVKGMAALGYLGANVTAPHKEAVLTIADHCSARARRAGAANVLAFKKSEILADNTDGEAFHRDLEQQMGFAVAGKRMLVIGAGGAARSILAALSEAGLSEVTVANRRPERAQQLMLDLQKAGALDGLTCTVVETTDLLTMRQKPFDLVVNTTPAGMDKPGNPLPWDWHGLPSDCLVVDLIYNPAETVFLQNARQAGFATRNGLGMLIGQAALSWEIWFGVEAPEGVMWAAATRALGIVTAKTGRSK
ncbi:MAG TPA: shikimate dehydrogenase [Firmicutes bacterium]|nr:shikimate dehydrogenase [Bacillota bacterium]